MRVTVRHHEACLVIPESSPKWRNFQLALNSHYGFFFLHILPLPTAFKLKCVLFCKYYANISTFLVKTSSVRLLPWTLTLWRLVEKDVKNLSWCQHWHHDVRKTFWRHARVALHPCVQGSIFFLEFTRPVGQVASNCYSSLIQLYQSLKLVL